ncbi:hypothetical protein CPB84DRAFT_1850787 [Gymnopilus junonius]|uniref:Uncharacterized protein n=1 Tax=Gymnopilus junonius TaxID=109634 RepID=A0A9P5TI83_GYMJU|nr:hypothetical protein CPB84DRAFT_1850787 [Gymnopilus junonius]
MAPTTKQIHKCDRFLNLISFRHEQLSSSSLNPTRQSFTTAIEGSGPSSGAHILAFSTDIVAAWSTTPPSQPYSSTPAPEAGHPDAISPPIKKQKAFVKGKSFEKDIALLSASFTLQEMPELKGLILLIAIIYDVDNEDKLTDILEICALFSLQLASAANANHDEALWTIKAFKGVIEKIRKAQLAGDTASLTDVEIANEISDIKPSFLRNAKSGPLE